MTIYLYLKTHTGTGYMYLGKTVQDPYKYKGSGLLWQRHLAKHGDNVDTQILLATEDKDELRNTALFFSKMLNVVHSDSFANLTEESGQGGYTLYTPSRNKKISEALQGRNNNWTLRGHNKGKVVAIDTETGNVVSITKEQFKCGKYKGIGSLHKGKPRKSTQGINNQAYGKKWYNNGEQRCRFVPGTEPHGWKLGKIF